MTPKKFAEAVKYNKTRLDDGSLTVEHLTALILEFQNSREDLLDDGKGGPLTVEALDTLLVRESPASLFNDWDGPATIQPANRDDLVRIFGHPGKTQANDTWVKENITYCHHTRGNRLPGVPKSRWVAIHKTVEPYLREALRRATIACPDYEIERIGGFVWRPIRHKIGNPLSIHSWGFAVDINPHKNKGKSFRIGTGPEAWSREWFKIWPETVPKDFVEAFRSCGFAWGADWDEDGISQDHDFYDPMHFEWIARDGNSLLV